MILSPTVTSSPGTVMDSTSVISAMFVVLDELLGQAGLTAGGQVDDVGELAALHGGADDVLQVLVDSRARR